MLTPYACFLAELGAERLYAPVNTGIQLNFEVEASSQRLLINPEHPDYKRIVVHDVTPLSYDPRMFRKQRSHRRH